jgi:oligoendopeptidase F
MEEKKRKLILEVAAVSLAIIATVSIIYKIRSNWKSQNPVSQNQSADKADETPERSAIEEKYKWNLADIYSTQADFDKDVEVARAKIEEFSQLNGTLSSDEKIKAALDKYYALSKKISHISSYAYMTYDQDTRDAEGARLKKIAENLGTDLGKASAFLDPELLNLPKEHLEALENSPSFKDYRMHITNLLRNTEHVLSNKEESLLAQSSIMQSAGYNIFSTFIDGDLKYPEIKLSDGQTVALTQSLFEKYRQSENHDDRKTVFENFFGTLDKYKNTFAQTLSAQVDANIFSAKARKFDSAAEAALFSENIPTSVYEKIIQNINDNLPVLQNYLELKKKLLGISDMSYYDLYAPVTSGLKDNYTYEKTESMIMDALRPMGEEYLKVASKATQAGNGWIDVYPSQGKSNGAYSNSVYGVHPYILLNFTGDYFSLSTEIHELGHTIHSYFSDANQPYINSNYSTFVAEIASTFNENLLLENRLRQETDKDKKIALLGKSLETMRTTIFRQALFSEFEYRIYQAAENNIPLTSDFLCETYLALVRKYYGDDKGVVSVADAVGVEWAYVPHFYYDFYVYQYVSGYLAGVAMSEKVFNGDTTMRDNYIEKVLKDGGSRYPLEQLKDVGIDMNADEVYREAFAIFQKRIDELKELTGQN